MALNPSTTPRKVPHSTLLRARCLSSLSFPKTLARPFFRSSLRNLQRPFSEAISCCYFSAPDCCHLPLYSENTFFDTPKTAPFLGFKYKPKKRLKNYFPLPQRTPAPLVGAPPLSVVHVKNFSYLCTTFSGKPPTLPHHNHPHHIAPTQNKKQKINPSCSLNLNPRAVCQLPAKNYCQQPKQPTTTHNQNNLPHHVPISRSLPQLSLLSP